LKALAQALRTDEAVQFVCPIARYALCLPVARDGRVEGYLAMCHSKEASPENHRHLAKLLVETALKEMDREEDLKNVSESIQPRCVALSTIHTIHRLISSTLNLEELLPRVARLCCQVLRAQFCTMWLMDREKHALVPRAAVSAQGEKRKTPPICRFGKGLVGKVAGSCRAKVAKRIMVVPLVEEECLGVLEVRRKSRKPPFGALDQEILTTLAEQAVVAIRNAQMYETQEGVTWGTIRSLSAILEGMESHSPSGKTHHKFLARVATLLAEKLKLPVHETRCLEYAAYLHDAGRAGVPEEILRKSARLSPSEFAIFKEHPVKGARMLEPLEILEPAIPLILHHHERFDGTGYPTGLKKEAIPLGARVLAVANAFEAMVFDRPYRKAMSVAQAADEIASHAGTQFDPKVVQAFLVLVQEKKLEPLLQARNS
jgi:HD-GYP domain-containing protein (c-di-GMP phosphodiesterase class II)